MNGTIYVHSLLYTSVYGLSQKYNTVVALSSQAAENWLVPCPLTVHILPYRIWYSQLLLIPVYIWMSSYIYDFSSQTTIWSMVLSNRPMETTVVLYSSLYFLVWILKVSFSGVFNSMQQKPWVPVLWKCGDQVLCSSYSCLDWTVLSVYVGCLIQYAALHSCCEVV